jgi:hypothetical protein
MTLRERIRRLRLYYRSGELFAERLADPGHARWLPFARADKEVRIRFVSGREFTLRGAQWPLLPSACRLERIGAEFEFLAGEKRVRLDGLTLYSPLWSRDEAAYYREVFLDDVYRIKGADLAGRVVVDVGAYVGDTALAFARAGAAVHALEPSRTFCGFIRKNLEVNGLAHRVTLHEVGLAERDCETRTRNDRLRFVEGVDYALANLPAGIELLKLDCEGAEYHLLADARFLGHLRPRAIRMEFHRGAGPLVAALERARYQVLSAGEGSVGLIEARRRG